MAMIPNKQVYLTDKQPRSRSINRMNQFDIDFENDLSKTATESEFDKEFENDLSNVKLSFNNNAFSDDSFNDGINTSLSSPVSAESRFNPNEKSSNKNETKQDSGWDSFRLNDFGLPVMKMRTYSKKANLISTSIKRRDKIAMSDILNANIDPPVNKIGDAFHNDTSLFSQDSYDDQIEYKNENYPLNLNSSPVKENSNIDFSYPSVKTKKNVTFSDETFEYLDSIDDKFITTRNKVHPKKMCSFQETQETTSSQSLFSSSLSKDSFVEEREILVLSDDDFSNHNVNRNINSSQVKNKDNLFSDDIINNLFVEAPQNLKPKWVHTVPTCSEKRESPALTSTETRNPSLLVKFKVDFNKLDQYIKDCEKIEDIFSVFENLDDVPITKKQKRTMDIQETTSDITSSQITENGFNSNETKNHRQEDGTHSGCEVKSDNLNETIKESLNEVYERQVSKPEKDKDHILETLTFDRDSNRKETTELSVSKVASNRRYGMTRSFLLNDFSDSDAEDINEEHYKHQDESSAKTAVSVKEKRRKPQISSSQTLQNFTDLKVSGISKTFNEDFSYFLEIFNSKKSSISQKRNSLLELCIKLIESRDFSQNLQILSMPQNIILDILQSNDLLLMTSFFQFTSTILKLNKNCNFSTSVISFFGNSYENLDTLKSAICLILKKGALFGFENIGKEINKIDTLTMNDWIHLVENKISQSTTKHNMAFIKITPYYLALEYLVVIIQNCGDDTTASNFPDSSFCFQIMRFSESLIDQLRNNANNGVILESLIISLSTMELYNVQFLEYPSNYNQLEKFLRKLFYLTDLNSSFQPSNSLFNCINSFSIVLTTTIGSEMVNIPKGVLDSIYNTKNLVARLNKLNENSCFQSCDLFSLGFILNLIDNDDIISFIENQNELQLKFQSMVKNLECLEIDVKRASDNEALNKQHCIGYFCIIVTTLIEKIETLKKNFGTDQIKKIIKNLKFFKDSILSANHNNSMTDRIDCCIAYCDKCII
ncbi:hypothetical protein B5S33_g4397 [[Candida] boidinii]|nr:hypothetical protein B5S33_g4397 [[Candida] boidinii]